MILDMPATRSPRVASSIDICECDSRYIGKPDGAQSAAPVAGHPFGSVHCFGHADAKNLTPCLNMDILMYLDAASGILIRNQLFCAIPSC